jgi:hypothetical protein
MAGGNRRGQLSEFLHTAVTARPELNPQLYEDGQHIYIVTEEGKKQYLSNSLEGQRFALACRCGQHHVRWATLHSILDPNSLFCQWCECELESWEGSGKDPVSAAEKEAMEALQCVGLDHTTACQVVLPFWPGRLDFYHIISDTVVQADGSSHFVYMHHRAPQLQLLSDIDCCVKAWREGVRLLRVHHEYAHIREAMIVATQLPHARFVMLTGCYERVRVWHKGRHRSYITLLKRKLRGARYLQMRVPGCIIFY